MFNSSIFFEKKTKNIDNYVKKLEKSNQKQFLSTARSKPVLFCYNMEK